MFKIKKSFILLLTFVLSILTFSAINIKNLNAAGATTTFSGTNSGVNDQGQYKVQSERAYNVLPYGIIQYTHFSSSSTTQNIGGSAAGSPSNIRNDPKANEGFVAGNFYDQQVNVLEVPSTTGVRVTSWANVKNNKWTLTPVRDLIADFEAKHPDEMVLAAINADGFDINGKKPLRYQTSGLHLSNGENYKTTTGTRKSLAFVNNGSVDSDRKSVV